MAGHLHLALALRKNSLCLPRITPALRWLNSVDLTLHTCVRTQHHFTNKCNKALISNVRDFIQCNPSWRRRTQDFNVRHFASRGTGPRYGSSDDSTVLIYITATGIFMLGLAYAGVPLYRMFCQATGQGGQAVQGHDASKVESMAPIKERKIHIRFNADTASSMQWNFRPQQTEVTVVPGETALAFYRAKNPTDKPIIGISTYNVIPFEAGLYFNKIQCFCFEEQRLNPHEEVDMPVFFFIDPDFADDPRMLDVDIVTLSYTFFEAKEGLNLPQPAFLSQMTQ